MRGHVDIATRGRFGGEVHVDVVAACDPNDPDTVTVVTGIYSSEDFAFAPQREQIDTGVSA